MPTPPVLAVLDLLAHVQDGGVDELFHARQAATRAARAHAGVDLVVAALCHDVGKVVADANHGRVAAELLRPFVNADVCAVVAVHQDFVAAHRSNGHAPDSRSRHAGRRWYDLAARFVEEWDAPSRDLAYDTWPIEAFVPALAEVFGRRPRHGRPGLARRMAEEAAASLRAGLGSAGRRRVDQLLGAGEAAVRIARLGGGRPLVTKVHILTRELGDSSLGGYGGFGWATRRCAALLAGQPDISCTIVTTRPPDRPTRAVDSIPLRVLSSSRWRREAWIRTHAPDVVLTVDYHTSFFRPLRRWIGAGTKAIVWARDPTGSVEQDIISTLRIPGDDDKPQGAARGDSTSMGVLDNILRRRGHHVTYAVPTLFLTPRVQSSYGVTAPTVEHLPNPIEPVHGTVTKSPTPVVAFLGRLDPIKRPWLFVDLARMLPDVRFVCMGSARLTGAGTWHPTDLPRNLELIGHAEEDRKRAELSRAWLLVNTSIHEGLPVSFCEALAHEVPIVSTIGTDDVPSRFGAHVGPAEGDGRSVLPDLRAAVAGLLADDERRLAFGAAGRAWVERTHSPAAFLETFRHLIGTR